MKSERVSCEEQSFWQLVFSQSKVNGATYEGERLSTSRWHWPTNTYLQRRRQLLKNNHIEPSDRDGVGAVMYQAMFEQAPGEFGEPSGSLRSN